MWAVGVEAPDGVRRLVLRRTPEGGIASELSIPIATDQPTRAYLKVIAREPEAVLSALQRS